MVEPTSWVSKHVECILVMNSAWAVFRPDFQAAMAQAGLSLGFPSDEVGQGKSIDSRAGELLPASVSTPTS